MKRTNLRLKFLLLTAFLLAATAILLGSRIQNELLLRMLLRKSAPTEEAVWGVIKGAPHEEKAILRLWRSNKIPIRAFTLGYINFFLRGDPRLYSQVEPLVIEAARDPDMSARELALAILSSHQSPILSELALAQLNDADPQIRLLGLQHLKRAEPPSLHPVAGLLEDPDLKVAATAATLLRRWTGQNFRVRVGLSVPDGGTGKLPPDKEQTLRTALSKWKDWWKVHQIEYPSEPEFTETERQAPERIRVADFALPTPEGRTVRLSDFADKTVLLNFWATWCTACIMEVPGLIELQNEFKDGLVILGVSLDGRPDVHDHGHSGRHESDGQTDHESAEEISDLQTIRKKVERFVKSKGINYPVVLNPEGDIGARFNGHELPTNVIIDPNGFLRRRFVGKRPLASVKQMIREVDPIADAPAR